MNHDDLTPEEAKTLQADLARFNDALTRIYTRTTSFVQSFAQDWDMVKDYLSPGTVEQYNALLVAIIQGQGVTAEFVRKYGNNDNEEN